MKKICIVVLLITLVVTGCSARTDKNSRIQTSGNPETEENVPEIEESTGNPNESAKSSPKNNQGTQLTEISNETNTISCCTEKGFYYLACYEDDNGNSYNRIHYIDFATKKEVVLCNKPDCKHDGKSCSAYINPECERQTIFTDQKYLYVLQSAYDSENSMGQSVLGIGEEEVSVETPKAFLYRMNLDGTDGKKVYEFEAGEVVTANVFEDQQYLYFYTKRLEDSKVNDTTEIAEVQQKNIVRVSMDKYSREDILQLDNSQQVIGCIDNMLILTKEQYDSKYSATERMQDDDKFKEAMESLVIEVSKFDVSEKKETVLKKIDQKGEKTVVVEDGVICYGVKGSGQIRIVDVTSGEDSVLAKTEFERIVFNYGGVLVCDSYKKAQLGESAVINIKDKTVSKWALTGSDGYDILVLAETKDNLIVLEDISSDSKPTFALLSKDDLYKQKKDYAKFNMLEDKGEFIP